MISFTYPTAGELESVFSRHRSQTQPGWRVRMRKKFGYYKPELWYQAVVDSLVTQDCRWIDVGGGKTMFSENHKLSIELAKRSGYLVGVDPSENIHQNELVNERAQTTIEDYHNDQAFDLATLRMVAEHITQPALAIESLQRLIKVGGHVVIYTPNKRSVMSLATSLIPNRFHGALIEFITRNRQAEDVFPTCYKMNTRAALRSHFGDFGFEEVSFSYLDDCVIAKRFRPTHFAELCVWKSFSGLGLVYPENNLLGVYQKTAE